jgi:hypothetical protein
MEEKTVYLAILNITSYVGQCSDAVHLYGKLILSHQKDVNIDNIEEWNVNYLGEEIELKTPLTLELAKKLDEKDGGNSYLRAYNLCKEEPEMAAKMEDYGKTNRFDTFKQIENVAINKCKELNLNCPFISLFDNEKYKANNYIDSSTVIIEQLNIIK